MWETKHGPSIELYLARGPKFEIEEGTKMLCFCIGGQEQRWRWGGEKSRTLGGSQEVSILAFSATSEK